MKTQPELEKIASQIRRDIIRQTWSAKSGHPGGSLGCADMMTSLFFNHLRFTLPFKMEGKDEDIFVLSNGHISPLFYSVLARSGFFLSMSLPLSARSIRGYRGTRPPTSTCREFALRQDRLDRV